MEMLRHLLQRGQGGGKDRNSDCNGHIVKKEHKVFICPSNPAEEVE